MSESAAKTAVTVEIAGESYVIRSEASPDHVRRCAEYVDATLQEHVRQGATVESHRAVILAALSLADQLFQARAEAQAVRGELARLAAEIEASPAAADLASSP